MSQFILAGNIMKNLNACQNHNFGGIKTLFDISLRLTAENSFEILKLSTMMYEFSPWMRMTLCHDQPIKWAKTTVHVYSASVLCLGRIRNPSEATTSGKNRVIISNNPTSTQNCLELMENQWSSSGIFSQDTHRSRFPDRFRKI